ncbi:MAG: hypothetical protein J0I20_35690 [Chloroflexi bacterium]|nr:hypothetical protein [Chloroflexota bacterium]OJV86947.1 MAG: hypothetical protein BGO39_28505 [Chloroflexi bacterium 54-19]
MNRLLSVRLFLIAVFIMSVVIACGDESTTTPIPTTTPTVSPTQTPIPPTFTPAPTATPTPDIGATVTAGIAQGIATANANNSFATQTARAIPTATPYPTGLKNPKIGISVPLIDKETLIGQNATKRGIKFTITDVAGYFEIHGYKDNKSYKPSKGMFLVMVYKIENGSNGPVQYSTPSLYDQSGSLQSLADTDAFTSLIGYIDIDTNIGPGKTGTQWCVYDVEPSINRMTIGLDLI